jgi:ribosomal protein L7/L12
MKLSWNETQAVAMVLSGQDVPLLDQVKLLLDQGATPVYCIKALREVHGVGLAAGKDLVDAALNPESREANEELRESVAQQLSEWNVC